MYNLYYTTHFFKEMHSDWNPHIWQNKKALLNFVFVKAVCPCCTTTWNTWAYYKPIVGQLYTLRMILCDAIIMIW